MNSRLIGFILAATCFTIGCADDDVGTATQPVEPDAEVVVDTTVPYLANNGFILEGSHANLLKSYRIAVPDDEGFVPGFDLDGVNTEEGDEASCRQGDFVDPDGRTGIDNQFADLWSIVEPLVGEATEALIQGAVNEGRIILVIELSGVDSLENDEDITVHIFRGRIDPDIGNLGFISPDQTVYVDREFPIEIVEGAQIIDGEVFARPDTIHLPVDILDSYFVIEMNQAQIRFSIDESGRFQGYFGGVVDLKSVFDELLASNASQEAALVQPIFYTYADMEKGPSGCTHASAAFGFSGTNAFVVRYPEESVHAERAEEMAHQSMQE